MVHGSYKGGSVLGDLRELLKKSYIQDVDTGYVGKAESLSEISGKENAVRGIFVTDEGKIINKSLYISRIEVIDQENAEEYFETIMTVLNIRANKIREFFRGDEGIE